MIIQESSILYFCKIDVFAVVVAEDLLVALATVDNRYTTARSRSAGSFVFCLLLRLFLLLTLEVVFPKGVLVAFGLFALLILGLRTARTVSTLAAFEVVAIEGISFLLLLDLLVAIVGILGLFTQFLHTFVGEVDYQHENDSKANQAEDNSGNQ